MELDKQCVEKCTTKFDDVIDLWGVGTSEGFGFFGSLNNFVVDDVTGAVSISVNCLDKKHSVSIVMEPEQFIKFAKVVNKIKNHLNLSE